jgi:hypothetical protein
MLMTKLLIPRPQVTLAEVTQEEIMNMFKNQLAHLKEHLNVSLAILTGLPSVTALVLYCRAKLSNGK